MGTLLKLPNELAFQIFSDLDNAALLALAKSCRHLNIIVTSHHLSRQHMPDPSCEIHLCVDEDFALLPFLRVSTLLTSSQEIESSFTTSNYLDEIHGLKRLIDKLSSVETVTLSMAFIPPSGTQKDEACFTKAISKLLTTIIARSCDSLSIDGGPTLWYSRRTSRKKAERIGLSKLSRVFIAPFRGILRQCSTPENISDILSPDALPASKLTYLSISSDTFFDHSFLQWTIHLINASPITTLYIINPHQEMVSWDGLLSTIHSPTLSDLFIADNPRRIPFSFLAAFLARHQTITSLFCLGLSRDGPNYPKFILPQLTSLLSDYQCSVHLLEDITAFPSLCGIYLHQNASAIFMPFHPVITNNALECVSRCPNELELVLKFIQEDEGFIAWLDVDVNDNSRVERLLHRVIRLKLFVDDLSPQTLLVFPKWLALFPALRLLSFQCVKTIPPKFAHSIIQACSQLKRLTINEEIHRVATWLAMED